MSTGETGASNCLKRRSTQSWRIAATSRDHLQALIEVARRRALEPIVLEDVEVDVIATERFPGSR